MVILVQQMHMDIFAHVECVVWVIIRIRKGITAVRILLVLHDGVSEKEE
jgi:hypothetical protein